MTFDDIIKETKEFSQSTGANICALYVFKYGKNGNILTNKENGMFRAIQFHTSNREATLSDKFQSVKDARCWLDGFQSAYMLSKNPNSP